MNQNLDQPDAITSNAQEVEINWEDFLYFAQDRIENWNKLRGLHIPHESLGIGEVVSLVGAGQYIEVRFQNLPKSLKFNRSGFLGSTAFLVPNYLAESVMAAVKIRIERERLLAEMADAKKREERDAKQRQALEEQKLRDDELRRRAEYEDALIKEQARLQKVKLERAESTIAHLTENGIHHLWHFTAIDNLQTIANSGYLYGWSKNPNPNGVVLLSDELSRELDQRFQRAHFVRLSYIPNSWYFHRVRWSKKLVWLRFSLQLFTTQVTKFSKGNAASGSVHLFDDLPNTGIDWAVLNEFKGNYNDEIGPRHYRTERVDAVADSQVFTTRKEMWNSELLIENMLPLTYCDGVYDANSGAKINIFR
jgi:hypothetical protein